MKAYERVETSRKLDPFLPIYARIDGRSFSRVTRHLKRPYDERMSRAMIETAKALVDQTHARIGFVQSDEISLVFLAEGETSSVFFDGKIQKMVSTLAGLATAVFQREILCHPDDEFRALATMNPHFDARVVQLPSRTEAANMLMWRWIDARKNAISMAAHAVCSPKALHGVSQEDRKALLAEKGIVFEDYPAYFRSGTFLCRTVVEKAVSMEDNPKFDPSSLIQKPDGTYAALRTIVREVAIDFGSARNREAIVFDGADPQC